MGRLAVAHDDEERIVQLTALGQKGDKTADLLVGLTDRPCVGRVRMEDVLRPRVVREVLARLNPPGHPRSLQHDAREHNVACRFEGVYDEVDHFCVGHARRGQDVVEAVIEGPVCRAAGRMHGLAPAAQDVLEKDGPLFKEGGAGEGRDVRKRRRVPCAVHADGGMGGEQQHPLVRPGAAIAQGLDVGKRKPVDRVRMQAIDLE